MEEHCEAEIKKNDKAESRENEQKGVLFARHHCATETNRRAQENVGRWQRIRPY